MYFRGLEAYIGSPDAQVMAGMEREHTAAADSHNHFTAPNYGVTTMPIVEWWFVVDPGRDVAWPIEVELAKSPERRRKPMAWRDLDAAVARQNVRLHSLGQPPLMVEEAIGARLYTGPM